MKNDNIVRPNTLKGNKKIDRMIELMGESVDKTVNKSVVELTKLGPDGKVYGIVRENHEYYIKTSDKSSDLLTEDFNYIGGLKNKKSEAYSTYAKAIKKLNLRFLSINESFGGERINVFESDNLLKENHATAGGSFGFVEEDVVEEMEDMNGDKAPEDKKTSGDNLDGEFDENPSASSTNQGDHKTGESGHDTEIIKEDDVELTKEESAIDSMIEGLDAVGDEDCDVDNDGDVDDSDEYLTNKRLKIGKAIDIEENEDRIEEFMSTLSESEKKALSASLKKKV